MFILCSTTDIMGLVLSSVIASWCGLLVRQSVYADLVVAVLRVERARVHDLDVER